MSEENKFFVVLDYCFQRLIMPADGPYICLPSQQMPQCYKSLLKRETCFSTQGNCIQAADKILQDRKTDSYMHRVTSQKYSWYFLLPMRLLGKGFVRTWLSAATTKNAHVIVMT